MSEANHRHHQHGGKDRDSVPHEHYPYWKRAHRDWRFWGAVFLMFAAMMIYAMSFNLPLRTHRPAPQPLSGAVGQ